MKSFKNYINEGIISGRGGAADKAKVLKIAVERWIKENLYIKPLYSRQVNLPKYRIEKEGLYIYGDFIVNPDIEHLPKPPINIAFVSGSVRLIDVKIKSLMYFPERVYRSVLIQNCKQLEDLSGYIKYVGGVFNCVDCPKLKTLKGAPEQVANERDLEGEDYLWEAYSHSIYIALLNIATLEGIPVVSNNRGRAGYKIHNCPRLRSLKGMEKLSTVDWLICSNNPGLKSLKGCPDRIVDEFSCSNCPELASLEGLRSVENTLCCSKNPNLKSLKGIPNSVLKLDCRETGITSFEDLDDKSSRLVTIHCEKCNNLKSYKGIPSGVSIIKSTHCDNIINFTDIPDGCYIEIDKKYRYLNIDKNKNINVKYN